MGRDQKLREMNDLRNEADSQIYAAEKSLKEYKDKLPESLVTEIETKVNALRLRNAMSPPEQEALKKCVSELKESVMKIGSAMSKQSNAQSGAQSDAQTGEKKSSEKKSKDENTTEAEYEDAKK